MASDAEAIMMGAQVYVYAGTVYRSVMPDEMDDELIQVYYRVFDIIYCTEFDGITTRAKLCLNTDISSWVEPVTDRIVKAHYLQAGGL